jgi:ribosomal protein L37AE/L43A
MGGYGSGKYGYCGKKATTNDYLCFDINILRKNGTWKIKNGILTWSINEENIGSIEYFVNAEQQEIFLSWYNTKEQKNVEQTIRLLSRKQKFGNYRYYFECSNCWRKVFKLYAGKIFYCHKCYNLTYVSCQKSHQFDSLAGVLGMSIKDFHEWEKVMLEDNQYWNADKKTRNKIDQKRLKQKNKKIF